MLRRSAEASYQRFRQVDEYIELLQVHEFEDGLLGDDFLEVFHFAAADGPGKGRAQLGVLQVLPGLAQRGLGGAVIRLHAVEVQLGDIAVLDQLTGPLEVALRVVKGCLAVFQGNLVIRWVQPGQELAALYCIPFLDQHFLEHAGNPERQVSALGGLHAAGEIANGLVTGALYGKDFYRPAGRRRHLGLLAATAKAGRCG